MGLCLSDFFTSCYIFVKIKLCVLYLVRFCYILSYFITWCYIFFEYQIACVTIPSRVHSRRVTCNFPCALSASSHLLKLNQFYQQQKRDYFKRTFSTREQSLKLIFTSSSLFINFSIGADDLTLGLKSIWEQWCQWCHRSTQSESFSLDQSNSAWWDDTCVYDVG